MTARKYQRAAELLGAGLNQRDAAALLEITPRTLRNWKADGKLPDVGGNGAGEEDTISLSDARRRKEAALAEKHELDAARQRGDLIEKSHLVDVVLRARRIIDSLPRRMCQRAAELLGLEPRQVLPMLEDVADALLEELRLELERWAQEEAAARIDTPLPEDVPHRKYLLRHGCETVQDVEELEDVTDVAGIGDARAADIRSWFEGD